MAPKKLSESDKQDILSRYRQSDETAASLATQYGVSTSTVSRLLKQSIPEQEYEVLVQQKRSGARTAELEDLPNINAISAALAVVLKADRSAPELDEPDDSQAEPQSEAPSKNRRQRRRSRLTQSESVSETASTGAPATEMQLDMLPFIELETVETEPNHDQAEEAAVVQEAAVLAERDSTVEPLDEAELDDDLDDDDLDDLDDDLDDEDDDDEDDLNGDEAIEMVHVQGKGMVNVLPLSEAQIPRTCYVVVDRSAELITRPLKDFADLGQIPPGEVQEKTLPVFDNHRVAKRFLRRMQRIVKVPDGRMFQKVTPYLQAKGITRLLIDGQIYSI